MSSMDEFTKRIGLNTDLENISAQICAKYGLGDFVSNKIIEIGYEDFNYYLTTTKGQYCVKIFSKARSSQDVDNYLARIRAVASSEVSSPKPLMVDGDIVLRLDYENNHYDICVFEFIDGKNYFEMNQKPSQEVIKELARQTTLINQLDIKPEFIYDTWAIINFEPEYAKKRAYLPEKYQVAFDQLLAEFKSLDLDKLPHGFVHGDIISTNVMLDKNQKIWILDFAVSNYLPRIIDLAVTSCNMCLDQNSEENTRANISTLLQEYDKYAPLTDYEKQSFRTFFKLANAMHIMSTLYLIATEGDSEENQYWLSEGEAGWAFSDAI